MQGTHAQTVLTRVAEKARDLGLELLPPHVVCSTVALRSEPPLHQVKISRTITSGYSNTLGPTL